VRTVPTHRIGATGHTGWYTKPTQQTQPCNRTSKKQPSNQYEIPKNKHTHSCGGGQWLRGRPHTLTPHETMARPKHDANHGKAEKKQKNLTARKTHDEIHVLRCWEKNRGDSATHTHTQRREHDNGGFSLGLRGTEREMGSKRERGMPQREQIGSGWPTCQNPTATPRLHNTTRPPLTNNLRAPEKRHPSIANRQNSM
jgi:hypothetical protein